MTRRKRILFSPTAERRAVLYARYSSENQRDSWSIDAQVADLRAYCTRMGWSVHDDICLDEAISGSTEDRPGLERAMALIRAGQANVLVVHKLDRFFRNMAKTFEYVADLEDCGAGLVCTQQPIDTTNPVSGKIVLAVMAALAEIYLDNLSEETSKGLRARAAAGLHNGRLPYGYRLAPTDTPGRGIAVIVPGEAEAVRLAFEWYATGQYGDGALARKLNAAGYRMRSTRHPDGCPFSKDTINIMLVNAFYAGWVLKPNDELRTWVGRARGAERYRGLHEACITQDLFERVQAARAARRGSDERTTDHAGGARAQFHHAYVAAGIARCAACGIRLRAQGKQGRAAQYRCTRAERGESCGGRRKSIKADLVDEALGVAVAGLQLAADWRSMLLGDVAAYEAQTRVLEAEREGIDRKLARIKTLLIDGDLDQASYRAERTRLERERAALAPPAEQVNLERAAAALADLEILWAAAAPTERREIAANLFDALYIDLDEPGRIDVQLKPAVHVLWEGINHHVTTRVIDGPLWDVWYRRWQPDRLAQLA